MTEYNLHSFEGCEPDVEIECTFLSTEEGGRNGPARVGYRPQFYYNGHDWDAAYAFTTEEWIPPGETFKALVCFLSPEAHQGRLYPGKEFELREGRHVVARGRVIRLLGLAVKE